ncbi:MAG: DPP IV N-terminal domain-containing protein, partial [Planctomycetota bacterium]|nr:DPP IV N-terminal domain-containing protein [Planctomycetota bacterium]
MRLVKIIESTAAASVIALLAACQSGPSTCAMPSSNADAPTPIAAIPAHNSVDFDARTGMVSSTSTAPATPPSGPTAGANPVDRAVRPLTLYGQLPDSGAARQSPLDSPDNLVRVTFADEGSDFDPCVDPSGQSVVYASTQHRQSADLYLKKIGGTTVTQLTNDPGNDVMPAFSPDGTRVAFASDRTGRWAIYLMDIQGGQPIQITSDANDNIHPSFSRDGKRLTYCSHGGQSGQWEIVVVNLDNPAAKHFIGHGLFPSFSPVDDRILFQRARERGTRWFSIWTVDLVNGEGMRPTEIAASSNAALITPSWSPDAKHIVFCSVIDPTPDDKTRPTQADIWIVGADGTA